MALSLLITIGQQVLQTAPHYVWQTFVVLGLEIIDVVLLALALGTSGSAPRPPEGPRGDWFARPACGRVRITDVDISEHSRSPALVSVDAAVAGPFAFGVAFT